jgi:hypothetical protein
MDKKSLYLLDHGWREVPSNVPGRTCWQAPPTCCQTPLYFALDAAYSLETEGDGIHAYAAQQSLGEALYAEDVRLMNLAEERQCR